MAQVEIKDKAIKLISITPLKINMEPKNWWFGVDAFSFPFGGICRFHVHFSPGDWRTNSFLGEFSTDRQIDSDDECAQFMAERRVAEKSKGRCFFCCCFFLGQCEVLESGGFFF